MIAIYTTRVIPKRKFNKDGLLRLTDCSLNIKTLIKDINKVKQIRIVPRSGYYKIEVLYEKDSKPLKDNSNYASIDLGVNNLATVSYSDGKEPYILNGKPLKSINQYYNKINKSKILHELPM